MENKIKGQCNTQLLPIPASSTNDTQLVPTSYGPSQAVVPFKEVRSEAEVKHGIVHFSTHFSRLQLHTDLNIPPSNWLRSSSKLEQHVRDLTWNSSRKPSQFSSIDIAHKSLDLAGEVDVITHSSNVKKLLKIPFEKSHISMMVHRVGKSLLLDEFDIHKHLLRQEQNEWAWLKSFYYESVLRDFHEKLKCVPRPCKTRNSLQKSNLYSKFLYRSLCDSENCDVSEVGHQSLVPAEDRPETYQRLVPTDDKLIIPDPLPQPAGSQTHREVLWTFEDIKMLIGTDLPVFRDDTGSYYVSLRLRDMRPINVLTGLDYWLDNLMCNVPEVAMCFHIDGIVQKYEVIKTEDIPHLEDSKFDPGVVTEIAKNILSFLKNNATKEGHTYWLYKGTDDDVVKLYDLTSLCSSLDQTGKNPFTVPLGMLLYRVARKLWKSQNPGKAPLIRTLLENCLYLLDEKKHVQVCTSASYMMSDIFVPDGSLHNDWSLPRNCSSEENSDEEESGEDTDKPGSENKTNSFPVTALSKTGSISRLNELCRLKPLSESIEDRCKEALTFIQRGLQYIEEHLVIGIVGPGSCIVEEQAKCSSHEAIPLHYEPLKKNVITGKPVPNDLEIASSNVQLDKAEHTGNSKSYSEDMQMTMVEPQCDQPSNYKGQTWHQLSKYLLIKKAALTFSALSKIYINRNDYLEAFKCLRLAFYCFAAMKTVMPYRAKENDILLSCLLSLSSDIRLVLSKSSQKNLELDIIMKSLPTEQRTILEIVEKDVQTFEFEDLFHIDDNIEIMLESCILSYSKALSLISEKMQEYVPLAKRKGNALNELGVCFMVKAQKVLETEDIQDKPSEDMEKLWESGQQAFRNGINVFEQVRDIANQALLHCNYGRLMRLCAQTYTHISIKGAKQEFTPKERQYYNWAIDHYKQALKLGHSFKNIVESVKWELSTTYFNMATLLQDYAPLSTSNKEEVENEIVNLMDTSLKYCKVETSLANQPVYQFRVATINYRLASMFHNSLRGNCSEQKKRYLRHLSEKHYIHALQLYQTMECHIEFLRVQLEFIALKDLCLSGQTNARSRLKLLQQMLQCLASCQDSVKGLTVQLDSEPGTNLFDNGKHVMCLIESRIQFVLLQLIKCYETCKKG